MSHRLSHSATNPCPRPITARGGFTMIEILAVVIIFGVLATVAMPKVQDIMRRSKLNAATAVVAGDLSHAFTLAARSRRPVRLTCDGAAGSYTIADRDTPDDVMVSRLIGSDKDMQVDAGKCSAGSVDFFPNGLASSGFDITIVSGDMGRLVTMSRAGKVRITRP